MIPVAPINVNVFPLTSMPFALTVYARGSYNSDTHFPEGAAYGTLTVPRSVTVMSPEARQTRPVSTTETELTSEFQAAVSEYLIRHRSILDILSKMHEATARVQRAVAKAVTLCGCVNINAQRQSVPEGTKYSELNQYVQNHLSGQLCEGCRDVLETELGQSFFYTVALCETLNLKSTDIFNQEKQRVTTLGVFNLT